MDQEKKSPMLSFRAGDWETRLGFHAGKESSVNFVFTLLWGLVSTAVFFGILHFFRTPDGMGPVDMFFPGGVKERSSIPVYTMFLTFWAIAILLDKWSKLRLQRRALAAQILPADPNFELTPLTAQEILQNIRLAAEDPRRFLLFDRIERTLANLKNLGDVGDVAATLKDQAENDDGFLSSSYTVVRGFIWAIPVLGFIGTVLGLSQAVGGFGAVVAQGADLEKLKNALGGVTAGLAVAFETTLIALVAALVVQLLMTFLEHAEEAFLDDCRDYCHKNIVSRLRSVMTAEPRER